jgi:hypothetical protein
MHFLSLRCREAIQQEFKSFETELLVALIDKISLIEIPSTKITSKNHLLATWLYNACNGPCCVVQLAKN